MRKRAYIERAAIRRAGEGTAGRDASAKPHEVGSIGLKTRKVEGLTLPILHYEVTVRIVRRLGTRCNATQNVLTLGPFEHAAAAHQARSDPACWRKHTTGRGASAKPHGRRPNYSRARPFNKCTAEMLSNGLLRLCRVVLIFTSYCRNILLQLKPSVVSF